MSDKQRKNDKRDEHVLENYNFDTFNKTWVDLMTKIHEEEGSGQENIQSVGL